MAEKVLGNESKSTATLSKPAEQKRPQVDKPKLLPPYKVILHNDDRNTFEHVIVTLINLTHLSEQESIQRTVEAHEQGCALVLVTHKERAELYEEQFRSASLTVTIEPDE